MKPIPYTTGENTVAASDSTNPLRVISVPSENEEDKRYIRDLERKLLGIPDIESTGFTIQDNVLQLIPIMFDHIRIEDPQGGPLYIHRSIVMNARMAQSSFHTVMEGLRLRRKSYQDKLKILNCTTFCRCKAHEMARDNSLSRSLINLLFILQEIEIIKDQSGATAIRALLEFGFREAGLEVNVSPKDTTLQVSCIACNKEGLNPICYNATPDITGTYQFTYQKSTILFGEVQSSPLDQMVVAGLGHIAFSKVEFILGVVMNKNRSAELYLLQKMSRAVSIQNETFSGPIKLSKLSTENYNLMEPEDLGKFFEKTVSVAKFIINKYHSADNLQVIDCFIDLDELPPEEERSPEEAPKRKSQRLQS